jgi:hypothetical protein
MSDSFLNTFAFNEHAPEQTLQQTGTAKSLGFMNKVESPAAELGR